MTRRQCILSFLAMALASATVMAAPATELRVTGTILPGACTPSFGHGAEAHFGSISSEKAKGRRRMALPAQQFQFTITCDVRTRVGVRPHDNQHHSADRNVSEELDEAGAPEDIFGLGHDNGRDLGGYEARFVPGTFQADGKPMDTISTSAGHHNWVKRRGGQIRHDVINAWAEHGSLTPAAFANLSGILRIRPVINTTEAVKQDANLDGSLTLELHYL